MMMKLPTLRRAALAASLLALAGAAAPAMAEDFRIAEAWKAALPDNDGILTGKQQATINMVAYGAAAAQLCDGLDIDPAKVEKAVNKVLSNGPKGLTRKEQVTRASNVLITLGTAKGIILAEGALHKAEFCATAMKDKADTETPNYWK